MHLVRRVLFSFLVVLFLQCDSISVTPLPTQLSVEEDVTNNATDTVDGMDNLHLAETTENAKVVQGSDEHTLDSSNVPKTEEEEENLKEPEHPTDSVEQAENVELETTDLEQFNITEQAEEATILSHQDSNATDDTENMHLVDNQDKPLTKTVEEEGQEPCTDPSHHHHSLDHESQTREHLEWNAKSVTQLMDRLVQMLEAPTAAWNEYRYITALRGPDGSLYVPQNHGQSTRKHLATLLGFADEIIVSKNALAQSDKESNEEHYTHHVNGSNASEASMNFETAEPEHEHLNTTPLLAEELPAKVHHSPEGKEVDDQIEQRMLNISTSDLPDPSHPPAFEEDSSETNEEHHMEEALLHSLEQLNFSQLIDKMEDLAKNVPADRFREFMEKPSALVNKLENLTKPFIDDLEAAAEKQLDSLFPTKEELSTVGEHSETDDHSEETRQDEDEDEEPEKEEEEEMEREEEHLREEELHV